MGTRITIQNVRISFPHLFQPRAVQAGDDPKYGVALLIPKNHPAVAQIGAAIAQEKANKWGANVPPSVSVPFHDGDTNPKYNTIEANHGHYIMNTSASADQQPVLVDQNLQKVINPSQFYAGCYVNADIGAYPYDKGVSKGVTFGLNGVQFVQDGERLDNRPSAEQMFGAPAGAPPPIAQGLAPAGVQPAVTPVAPAPVGAPAVGTPPPAFLG